MTYNYLVRVIILGHPGVGKSSLLSRLNNKEPSIDYEPTIGVDFGVTYTYLLNNIIVKTHLWDTAGQEYFSPIVCTYYRDIAGAILIFDVSKRETFQRINYWLKELHNINKQPGPLVLIGNKTDISSRTVSEEEARQFAQENNMTYYEISVKNNENVVFFYHNFIKSIYETIDGEPLPPGIKKFSLDIPKKNQIPDVKCCYLM
jgi:small GTP-binding protein